MPKGRLSGVARIDTAMSLPALSAIALSGITTARAGLETAGHNIANLGTPGFRRQIASAETLPGGGVAPRVDRAPEPGSAPEADLVALIAGRHAFEANVAVFRTADKTTGTLLDTLA